MSGSVSPSQLKADYTYLPALDGLRAISILLVVISHAGQGFEKIVPGGLGVLVFFVISGFLITRQMLAEIESTGTLNLPRFYLRRVLRLAPALLVYIALFSLLLGLLGAVITPTHILTGIFYLANYYHIFIGYPAYSPFPIIWSLSVEEHYYILFPCIMLIFRKNSIRLVPWLLVLMAVTLAWRYQLFSLCGDNTSGGICGIPQNSRLHGTDTIFDCILYGALIAIWLQCKPVHSSKYILGLPQQLVSLLILALTLFYRDEQFRDTIRFSLQSMAVAVLIVNTLFGRDRLSRFARRCMAFPPMILIGKLSYSLYLFHFGVLNVLAITDVPLGAMRIVIYLTFSFVCALISYYLVEKPMVAVRKRYGGHTKK